MPLGAVLALAALIILAALVFYSIPSYWWAKNESFLRHRAGASILKTPRGDLEYAVQGEGIPILVMHGAGGGYRQGLLLARLVDTRRFQVIGLSRPGYRYTPLEVGRSFEEQAAAARDLLDHLRIERAAVLGISAGGTPAIQFALRHPDRCRGLILLSAALPVPGGAKLLPFVPTLFRLAMAFDYPIWLALKPPLRFQLAPHGWIDPRRLDDPRTATLLHAIFDEMFPASAWRGGVLNDLHQYGRHYGNLPLEQIRVPALVIHGTHDRAAPYAAGRYAAGHIPSARMVSVERGTHFIVATHWREVGAEIEKFLAGNL